MNPGTKGGTGWLFTEAHVLVPSQVIVTDAMVEDGAYIGGYISLCDDRLAANRYAQASQYVKHPTVKTIVVIDEEHMLELWQCSHAVYSTEYITPCIQPLDLMVNGTHKCPPNIVF
jgi:hypothetical protein